MTHSFQDTKLDLSQYAIVSDFDGTITVQDSNETLFKILGNAQNAEIERMFAAGEIGSRDAFIKHFDCLDLDEDKYSRFITEHIELDKNFIEFYEKVREKGIPFVVVSAGFVNGIELLFQRNGLKDITVFANRLVSEKGLLKVKFLLEAEQCDYGYGVCGNCKVKQLEPFKRTGRKIIFIGDGITDKCAAKEADIVFAKKGLAKHCSDNGIDYIGYESYKDITDLLF